MKSIPGTHDTITKDNLTWIDHAKVEYVSGSDDALRNLAMDNMTARWGKSSPLQFKRRVEPRK